MKYPIYFLLTLLIVSCSKDESATDNQSNSKFSPPEWIVGTWENRTESAGTTLVLRYEFTNDNMIEEQETNGNVIVSINSKIFYANDAFTISEVKNSDMYSIIAETNTDAFDQTVYKEFAKVSSNQFEFTAVSGLETGLIFTKQ